MAASTAAIRTTRTAEGASSVSYDYDRFAGIMGLLAGISGFLYSVSFVVLRSEVLSGLFLGLSAILASAALIAVYERVRPAAPSFALWAMALGLAALAGALLHGGYDLANALHPPAALNADLPSQVDPRGLFTFGLAGLSTLLLGWLIVASGRLPRGLGYLGYLLGVLLVLLYLARLVVLDATSPLVLAPALLTGFIVSPVWYVWLGLTFWRAPVAA